jgi:hypothetical protein
MVIEIEMYYFVNNYPQGLVTMSVTNAYDASKLSQEQ